MDLMVSVLMGDPIWQSPRRDYVGALTGNLIGYGHEVQAMGGYWQAGISTRIRGHLFSDLVLNGLGRHIETYNPYQTRIWEGFINQVEIAWGRYSVVIGPLIGGVVNSDKVVYSTIDTSTSPPTLGIRAETSLADDADSQAKYGVIRRILSAGGMTATEAEQVRDLYLFDNKYPRATQDFSGRGGLQVDLECLGYVHLLDAFPYINTGTGTQNASTKIQQVAAAHPNSIFSTDYSQIQENTFPVAVGEDGNSTGWGVIKATVGKGDASDNRWLFGVYDNRRVYYAQIPMALEYQQRISLTGHGIERLGGGKIKPWDIKPGKWMIRNDVLIGLGQPADLFADPRVSFLEAIKYKAPYDVQPVGGRVSNIQQRLAKLGLGGV